MRALSVVLTATVYAWLFGCVRFPQMNLREPIYLVAHESLFANCTDNLLDEAACREHIMSQVRVGAFEWSRFFAQVQPLFMVLTSKDYIPDSAINPPVHIKVQAGMCGETAKDLVEACYIGKSYRADPEIVLTSIKHLRASLIAHELGHVLAGPEHYSGNMPSIMADGSLVEHVQPIDIDWVCARHSYCPVRESLDRVWEKEVSANELEY